MDKIKKGSSQNAPVAAQDNQNNQKIQNDNTASNGSTNTDPLTANNSQSNSGENSNNSEKKQTEQEKKFLNKFTTDQIEEEYRKKEQQVTKQGEKLKLAKSTFAAFANSNVDKIKELYEKDPDTVNEILQDSYGKTYEDIVSDNNPDDNSTNNEDNELLKRLEKLEKRENDKELNDFIKEQDIEKEKLEKALDYVDKNLPYNKQLEVAGKLAKDNSSSQKKAENNAVNDFKKQNASIGSMSSNTVGSKANDSVQLTEEEAYFLKMNPNIDPKLMVKYRK